MTEPTREQVIQAAPPEAYTAEDRAFHAFFYSHMRDEVMQPPLHEIGYVTARYIYAAARAQALDEAAGACRAREQGHEQARENWAAWGSVTETAGAVARRDEAENCVSAIQALKGKQ